MTETEIKKALEIFAHKLKNPLHAASLNLEVLHSKLQQQGIDKKTQQHLDLTIKDLQRMQTIVEKFFHYLDQSPTERKKIALKSYLQE